jgi:hypothetical protein
VSDPSRSDRVVGPDSVRSRMKSRLLGAVAGVAACAGLIAWLPLGYSKPPLVPQASGNSVTVPAAGASPLPAPTEVTSSGQPALPKKNPAALPIRVSTTKVSSLDPPRLTPRGEPQTHAATAEKPLSKKRGDALRSRKLAHSQKKTDRKTRPTDPDDGFGPPFTIGRLLGLERGTRLGFVEDDRRNTGRATQHGSPSWFFHW